jgi:hypothetical protein
MDINDERWAHLARERTKSQDLRLREHASNNSAENAVEFEAIACRTDLPAGDRARF